MVLPIKPTPVVHTLRNATICSDLFLSDCQKNSWPEKVLIENTNKINPWWKISKFLMNFCKSKTTSNSNLLYSCLRTWSLGTKTLFWPNKLLNYIETGNFPKNWVCQKRHFWPQNSNSENTLLYILLLYYFYKVWSDLPKSHSFFVNFFDGLFSLIFPSKPLKWCWGQNFRQNIIFFFIQGYATTYCGHL